MQDLDDAVAHVSESEWPAYLYSSNTSPDVENDQDGLFRGELLPIVSSLIVHASDI